MGIRMDKIKIHNLEIFCNHGVFPEETKLGQKFLVSAILYTDTREAGISNDLTKSIHYGEICHQMKRFMKENTYPLIESAAENLARYLLLNTENLVKLELEIKKPWAPIGLHLETVAVNIERGWHTAYIALGSNMGDKRAYLQEAVDALSKQEECIVANVSEFIETKPYGGVEQDTFLNGCLKLLTLLTPKELLSKLHEIEQAANRERKVHWGPRTLDLDIIFYDDLIMDGEDLTIPHADMQNRDFVLIPLSQIAPCIRHPLLGKTVMQMKESLLPEK